MSVIPANLFAKAREGTRQIRIPFIDWSLIDTLLISRVKIYVVGIIDVPIEFDSVTATRPIVSFLAGLMSAFINNEFHLHVRNLSY